VVLLGPTNAGKSSLFNALQGADRAIVTEVAGTTRDFLEEPLQLRGVGVRLVDTAGLRATSPAETLEDDTSGSAKTSEQEVDAVEQIGMERSRELKGKADVVVWVVDRSEGLEQSQLDELKALREGETPVVVVLNKADKPSGLQDLEREVVEGFDRVLETSAVDPQAGETQGIEELADQLGGLAEELTSGEGVLLSRARHLEHVRQAVESLEQAKRGIEAGMDHEFVAVDMREALDALGEIVGHVSTDDILGRIFSEFCVGK
jgi:tRNA modification GTPase